MMKPFQILTLSIAALAFPACDKPATTTIVIEDRRPAAEPVSATETFETARLGQTIDAYEKAPTAENTADVNKAFAELEGEIAELDARVAKTSGSDRAEAAQKAVNLRSYRDAERLRFAKVSALSAVPAVKVDARAAGEKIEDGARKVGEGVEDAAKKVGDGLKDAANAIKDVAK